MAFLSAEDVAWLVVWGRPKPPPNTEHYRDGLFVVEVPFV